MILARLAAFQPDIASAVDGYLYRLIPDGGRSEAGEPIAVVHPDGGLTDQEARALARRAVLRDRAGLRRELLPRGPHDRLIDLAGNDYLGLSQHPDVLLF